MKLVKLIVLALAALVTVSCNDTSELVKQNVGGKAGEIIIVANKAEWESEPGSELRSILATPYPYLPQSEPSYTLINIPHKSFTSLFEYHRNIIILKVDPQLKAEFKAVEDVWAAPQTVIMITAPLLLSGQVRMYLPDSLRQEYHPVLPHLRHNYKSLQT